MLFQTLSYVGEKLNEEGILWGIGASLLLNHYGLENHPNDIDLLIDLNDIEKADKIFSEIGKKKDSLKLGTYGTKNFKEYVVNGIDIDIMGGLIINHEDGIYEYVFDENSIDGYKEIEGIKIPLTTLEDWYILYSLIPNRGTKVKLIEEYLLKNGIKRPDLLKRSLEGSLPSNVKELVGELLILNIMD